MKKKTCFVSWSAEPYCTGWVAEGHPFHGCELQESHTYRGPWNERDHRCKCGEVLRRRRRRSVS